MPPSPIDTNLAWLARHAPALHQRLWQEPSDGHVERWRDGWRLRVGRQVVGLALPPEAIARAVRDAPEDAVLFGVGLGELVEALLLDPHRTVTAWDRDPWMLRRLLSRVDLTPALAAGRLTLLLDEQVVRLQGVGQAVEHPILAAHYSLERSWLTAAPDAPRTLVVSP